ncbi:hypothetical protein FNF29_08491 [Cafeteria roenbergensis]|nr:hypothetical protein FNF29_08491 [Cafeteria roenbergensis]|eukprot:KAA0145539.1 hypothetical protein FNF29_08491 [Cafeteria roenbergensis]
MVSIMEARTMRSFGIQWHPERSQFDWRPSIQGPPRPRGNRLRAGLADAFVNIARLSPHSMSTEQHRRMVLQTATRAAKRVSMGDLETSVTALLFDPPTPTAAEDGSRTVLGGHAWRLPADQVTDHSAQQPAAATNVTANATLADAPADEAAEAEGAEAQAEAAAEAEAEAEAGAEAEAEAEAGAEAEAEAEAGAEAEAEAEAGAEAAAGADAAEQDMSLLQRVATAAGKPPLCALGLGPQARQRDVHGLAAAHDQAGCPS